nr:hypothetical protein L203_01619 [Cryptococcus depauperatus CBS 7841]
MKGASDGGIFISHNEEQFPDYDFKTNELDAKVGQQYIVGGHVAEYMKSLEEDDERVTGDLSEKGEVLKGEDAVSPAWEWVGVVRVRGSGRGIVNQADGMIMRWVCLKLIDMIIYEDQPQNIVTQEPAFSNL